MFKNNENDSEDIIDISMLFEPNDSEEISRKPNAALSFLFKHTSSQIAENIFKSLTKEDRQNLCEQACTEIKNKHSEKIGPYDYILPMPPNGSDGIILIVNSEEFNKIKPYTWEIIDNGVTYKIPIEIRNYYTNHEEAFKDLDPDNMPAFYKHNDICKTVRAIIEDKYFFEKDYGIKSIGYAASYNYMYISIEMGTSKAIQEASKTIPDYYDIEHEGVNYRIPIIKEYLEGMAVLYNNIATQSPDNSYKNQRKVSLSNSQ